MAELKSSTMTNGEQFAMMLGASMTLTWLADSLVSQGWLPKGLALFGWMTWPAQAANHISTIADIVGGARMIALIAEIPARFVDTAHRTFGWQMVVITLAVLKFTAVGNGAQCAMISGISMMPMWCVASLDSPAQLTSTTVRNMAKAPGEFVWIM